MGTSNYSDEFQRDVAMQQRQVWCRVSITEKMDEECYRWTV